MNIKHKFIQFTLLFVHFNVKYLRYYNVFVMLSHLTVHIGQIVMFSGNTRASYAQVNIM